MHDTSAPADAASGRVSFEPNPALVAGALAVAMLALQLPFLTEAYRITVDEAWYSQTAHAIASGHGIQNEVVGSGGGDVFFLHPLILSAVFQITGTTFYAGRLCSVALGVLAVVGLSAVLFRLGLCWKEVSLCGLAFIASNLSYLTFRAIRPESAATAFSIWSVYFLLGALRWRSPRSAALCGLAVGAAFLSHPALALLVALVGFALLVDAVRGRDFSAVLAYSGVALAVLALLLVFMQVSQEGGIVGALTRMGSRTAHAGAESSGLLTSSLHNAAHFFSRIHAGGRRAPIVLLEILVLGWGLINVRRLHWARIMPLIPFGFLVIGFVTLRPFGLRSFTVVEWMVLATFGLLIAELARAGVRWKVHAARAGLVLLVLNNLAGDLYVIKRDHDAIPYAELSREIASTVPPGSTVMSHMLFWFPLQQSKMYSSYTRWQLEVPANLDELLGAGEVDYVVLLDHRGMSIITSGATGADKSSNPVMSYRDRMQEWADQNGTLIAEIPARGYGTVGIWRIDHS